MSVCLCMRYRVSHLTHSREIWYWELFWKSVERMRILSQWGKNFGHVTWRRNMFYCCWRQGLFSSEMVSGCWDSRVVNKITWTRRSVSLCVRCVYIVLNAHNRQSLPRESDIQCAQHIRRGPSRFNILINDIVVCII